MSSKHGAVVVLDDQRPQHRLGDRIKDVKGKNRCGAVGMQAMSVPVVQSDGGPMHDGDVIEVDLSAHIDGWGEDRLHIGTMCGLHDLQFDDQFGRIQTPTIDRQLQWCPFGRVFKVGRVFDRTEPPSIGVDQPGGQSDAGVLDIPHPHQVETSRSVPGRTGTMPGRVRAAMDWPSSWNSNP